MFFLGNIHVLRNHKGGREGVSQMLTIAYVGGEGLRGHAYVIIIWKKMLNDLHYLPKTLLFLPKVEIGKSYCSFLEGIKI